MANKKRDQQQTPKKGHGLSKAEKIAIPIIIIIAIWIVYSVTQPPSTGSTSLQVTYSSTTSVSQSASAPDFTLPVVDSNGLTGQTLTLASFQGKVVVLEFMEPWCPHCQNMAPVLDSLYSQYGASVVFISVAGPWNSATATDAASFIQKYGTHWAYVYDESSTAFTEYGVTSTPTFFIIGKNGSVLTSFSGEQSSDTLSSAISQALNS